MAEVEKRTRRSKPTPASVAPAPAPAPVPAEVPAPAAPRANKVDQATFWRMQHASAQAATAKAEMETLRMTKLYILALLDPKGRVAAAEKKLAEVQKRLETHENLQQQLRRTIEGSIGRALSNVAIDPETGEVFDAPTSK